MNSNTNNTQHSVAGSSESMFRSMTMIEQRNPFTVNDVTHNEKLTTKSIPAFQVRTDGWITPVLTTVGLYYPLSYSNSLKMSRDKLGHVLQTLQLIFRSLSLHTRYHNSPISAECISMDQVKLEVVIFAARDDASQMIIEISRISGDSFLFQRYAQQMILVISGQEDPRRPVTVPCSLSNKDALNQVDHVMGNDFNVNEHDILQALGIVWTMITTGRYDAQKLGLECLVQMTDAERSGWSVAQRYAQILLHPSSSMEEQLSRFVLDLALREAVGSTINNNGNNKDNDDEDHNNNNNLFMEATMAVEDVSYLGLVILSQTFQIAASAKNIDIQSFLDNKNWLDVVGCLVRMVGDVQHRPHHAYYAVQSLVALCDCLPALCARINFAHVLEAQMVGEAGHTALAAVSERLLISLQA